MGWPSHRPRLEAGAGLQANLVGGQRSVGCIVSAHQFVDGTIEIQDFDKIATQRRIVVEGRRERGHFVRGKLPVGIALICSIQ